MFLSRSPPHTLHPTPRTGHTSLISAVRFEPDSGHYLLTAGYDNTSRMWGGPRFRLLRTLAGHEGKVMGADISPDGSFTVATTGYDRTIKVRGAARWPPGLLLRALMRHSWCAPLHATCHWHACQPTPLACPAFLATVQLYGPDPLADIEAAGEEGSGIPA